MSISMVPTLARFRGARGRKTKNRSRGATLESRPFIAWDGEGCNSSGPGAPQDYILFGCSTGDHVSGRSLDTYECLDLICDVEQRYPDAVHVAFAFSYDVNEIVKALPRNKLERLNRHGSCRLKGGKYRIEWRKGKLFRVTKYGAAYPEIKTDYVSATIYDTFSFFACSFVKACRDLLGNSAQLDFVEKGKARRNEFHFYELETEIKPYWTAELELMRELMERFRELVYDAGLFITQWHGPGALASFVLKKQRVHNHMAQPPEAVSIASQVAYAGGRFELFKIGRHLGDVWSYDINSAYPHAISQLPSLHGGHWEYHHEVDRIHRFGLYHIRMANGGMFDKAPSPLFLRDEKHHIFYPWVVEGWYWSPEAYVVQRQVRDATILGGWVFSPANDDQPFRWLPDMYAQRRAWKNDGIPAQLALKLCMNSLYGKSAQRVGWDRSNNLPPRWHQLEWAGWVTSYTRARLYELMSRMSFSSLIGVETDGVYSTASPASLGITNSTDLGGWEVGHYDEMVYLQSGFYFARSGECADSRCDHSPRWKSRGCAWTDKYRGFDPGSVTVSSATEYLNSIEPKSIFPSLEGRTSRFVGLGAALASGRNFRSRHCRWENAQPRILSPGNEGKRIHFIPNCSACRAGHGPSEALHDLCIQSLTGTRYSVPHSLPWKGEDNPWWEYQEARLDDVTTF